MEAMAAGTPVLVTPGVPLAALVEKFDTGWVTSLGPTAIAFVIATALNPGTDPDTVVHVVNDVEFWQQILAWEHIAT